MRGNNADGVNVLSDENTLTRNAISANGDNGISVWGSANRIVRNASIDDDVNGFGSYDLFDGNGYFTGDCDSNTWSDNRWGAAGFFPDCASAGSGGARRSAVRATTGRLKSSPMLSARQALLPAPRSWASPQTFRSPRQPR